MKTTWNFLCSWTIWFHLDQIIYIYILSIWLNKWILSIFISYINFSSVLACKFAIKLFWSYVREYYWWWCLGSRKKRCWWGSIRRRIYMYRVVKYDLRLSRANITFIIDPLSNSSQLIRFSYEHILNMLIGLIMTNIISLLVQSWVPNSFCHKQTNGSKSAIGIAINDYIYVTFFLMVRTCTG